MSGSEPGGGDGVDGVDGVDSVDGVIERLLGSMTLDEKCSLTAGSSHWYLPPIPRLNIPALKVSDGPSGVRGDGLIGRRSLSLPCGMAIGSTWNPELVHRLGEVLAAEARSKGVHVLLGPTICIPRTPLAGRTFESFSEDPLLTARIAVAYVSGVQSEPSEPAPNEAPDQTAHEPVGTHRVACCVKHFACNDQEHERLTISAEVSERTLREIHLVGFEHAVQEAHVWSLMTAYNKVNGIYCGEQPHLITDILRDQFGFDGLVMSDWFGTHSTAPAAVAGLDLEMPGPPVWFGPSLAAAVRDELIDESVVDRQVRNVLLLMARVGILPQTPEAPDAARASTPTSGTASPGAAPSAAPSAASDSVSHSASRSLTQPVEELEEDDAGRRAVARHVSAEGTVLLVNEGLLPLDPKSVTSVAVVGPNASLLAMGGGSSEVTPHRRRSVAEALSERLPDAHIVHEVGCRIDRGLPSIDMRLIGGGAGFMVEYFDTPDQPVVMAARPTASQQAAPVEAAPVEAGLAHSARVMWLGPPRPNLEVGRCAVRISGTFTPDVSGVWTLGLESAGRSVLRLDADVVVDNSEPKRGVGFYGAGSEPIEAKHELQAGRAYQLVVELWPRSPSSPILGARVGASRPEVADEFEAAVDAAREADLAVVVVGSNAQWESEGHDRPDLSLPGRQRELVEAVLDANPRTVIAVNAGSPVEMPWAHRAAAVLVTWYPGEEGADALADILVGALEPTGRLPITFPGQVSDGPTGAAALHYPGVDGKVVYEEGVLVGYRHYETTNVAPMFEFGFGLSYGDIVYEQIDVTAERITVTLANTGKHRGTEVVQVYVRALEPRVERPDRELVGFLKVAVDAGQREKVQLELNAASFRYWDVETNDWRSDPGRYEVLVGSSSRNIRATVPISWAPEATTEARSR